MKELKALQKRIAQGTFLATCALALCAIWAQVNSTPVGCHADDLLLQNTLAAELSTDAPADGDKVVYLTFDDGPSPVTEDILDVLKAAQVPASFFVISAPNNEDSFPLVARIAQEGHCIALHSCTHDYKQIYASTDAFWADLQQLQDALTAQGVTPSNVLRFPGGSTNTVSHKYGGSGIMDALKTQAAERGFTCVDWNVCADDAIGTNPSPTTIYNTIIHGVDGKHTCIVLMHDSNKNGNTAAALADVIAWFQNAGYRFDTVDHIDAT